jgi:phosphoenolpyruvate carboxylase
MYDSLVLKKTLENSMMSLAKSFFPLTAYMKKDPSLEHFGKLFMMNF